MFAHISNHLKGSMMDLDLQVAYRISEEVTERSTPELFWAMDRFWHDMKDQGVHARHQRSEATQRIAKELDARNVPVRDPNGPKAYPGVKP